MVALGNGVVVFSEAETTLMNTKLVSWRSQALANSQFVFANSTTATSGRARLSVRRLKQATRRALTEQYEMIDPSVSSAAASTLGYADGANVCLES